MSDGVPVALAERVLGILNEGSFSATYKFALFIAILDLCIEKTSNSGEPPSSLTTRELAQKVIELYWPQVVPYEGCGVLRFGGGIGEQAEIVTRIRKLRMQVGDAEGTTWYRARQASPRNYAQLGRFVEWKLVEMPIPRLQVLGRQEEQFLYRYNWTTGIRRGIVTAYQEGVPGTFDNRLLLLPGVADSLTRLNGILRPLFHRQWAVMVARLNNLPEAHLERFLFGGERIALTAVREPLRELQAGQCFYCGRQIRERGEVDHFIPWSRYPDDGLDNLVLAHPRCNNSKRDFLAAVPHLRRWATRSLELDKALSQVADVTNLLRDRERTRAVARALYLPLPVGTRLWLRPSEFEPWARCCLDLDLGSCGPEVLLGERS